MKRMSVHSSQQLKQSPVFPEQGLRFLRNLKRHNNREWFMAHKSDYETLVRAPMHDLVEAISHEFARFAPDILATPKASLYRINRDTRFSSDKKPYKTHVAASFRPRDLPRHEGAGFYFHIAPDEMFVGGGLYMPLPEDLRTVRESVAHNYSAFTKIVRAPSFRRLFGDVTGDRLVRVPRGFDPEHPAADYLRLKQFLASRTLPSPSASSPSFFRVLTETFETLSPFVRFLNEPLLQSRRNRNRQEALLK